MDDNVAAITQIGLDILRLKLRFRVLTPVSLPQAPGAMWRNVLGPALKRIGADDVFHILFQPKPTAALGDAQKRFGTPPPIFALAATAPTLALPDDTLELQVSLFGQAGSALSLIHISEPTRR